MLENELIPILDSTLSALGATSDPGEEYRDPPLDILRYYRRKARVSTLPILGRALSVVALIRQPVDIGFPEAYSTFLDRATRAADDRYPPWGRPGGFALGLTFVVLTPEPIGGADDEALGKILAGRKRRSRVVPLALIRLNLGQEAMAFSLVAGPPGVFPEPEAVVDALTPHFRRYVPFLIL